MNEFSFPKTIDDRYELQDQIGSGGMGLIVKAHDIRLKRTVAIKLISDRVKDASVRRNIRERFFNEARAAGALSHPNLVQIYDFGEKDDVVYIVMEYIEGETLEQFIKSRGPLNLDQIITTTKELASGLAFAHKRGIVHRDIKPSNVIIEADSGVTKILDFGIAKFVDEEEMKLTSTGMVLGSTHYLSPEHITGRNLDNRSDVFCLGTLLYEASTGTLPFRGQNSSTILYKIIHFDPPLPQELRPDLPSAVSGMIKRCLQKNPAERFQKCEEIIDAVKKIERSFKNRDSGDQSPSAKEANIFQQSYFVRDSQLLTALVTQKKLDNQEATHYRGKAVYDLLLKNASVAEDDLSAVIGECLNLPWIPKGRLKSLRISEAAFQKFDKEKLKKYSILPFYYDDSTKTISIVIDGVTDFQRDPKISELLSEHFFQFYVSGRQTIQRLIQMQEGQGGLDREDNLLRATDELLASDKIVDKRILLVEPQKHYQAAIVSLLKGNETALTIVSSIDEAKTKVKNDHFHHVWASRDIVGDELAFETLVIRNNPSADIRFYDDLSEELFEDSIHYSKFRDFFARTVMQFLSLNGGKEERLLAQRSAALAVKIAKVETQNQRELDEVYFSVLFYKFEKLVQVKQSLSQTLSGIYRFRHIWNCIGERFDGRGPLGIKQNQIPLSSRLIAAMSVIERANPRAEKWTPEQVKEVEKSYDNYSGKQLDPILVSEILDSIRPDKTERSKGLKVAIVDSDEAYSAQLKAHLNRIHADTQVYSDGVSALAQMKKNRPDLIVSEVIVSKLDGFALAARVRADAILKDVPLVFVSESKRPEHSVKAIQLGAEDFISKESEPKFIVAKIEKLLQSK